MPYDCSKDNSWDFTCLVTGHFTHVFCSDIYIVANADGKQFALKLHR